MENKKICTKEKQKISIHQYVQVFYVGNFQFAALKEFVSKVLDRLFKLKISWWAYWFHAWGDDDDDDDNAVDGDNNDDRDDDDEDIDEGTYCDSIET